MTTPRSKDQVKLDGADDDRMGWPSFRSRVANQYDARA